MLIHSSHPVTEGSTNYTSQDDYVLMLYKNAN